jgi:hypothetical protein
MICTLSAALSAGSLRDGPLRFWPWGRFGMGVVSHNCCIPGGGNCAALDPSSVLPTMTGLTRNKFPRVAQPVTWKLAGGKVL